MYECRVQSDPADDGATVLSSGGWGPVTYRDSDLTGLGCNFNRSLEGSNVHHLSYLRLTCTYQRPRKEDEEKWKGKPTSRPTTFNTHSHHNPQPTFEHPASPLHPLPRPHSSPAWTSSIPIQPSCSVFSGLHSKLRLVRSTHSRKVIHG